MKLEITGLSKSFGALLVLNQVTLSLTSDRSYCLMGPSGSGKTTLFQILLGLMTADAGSIRGMEGKQVSAVFQEDRLCEAFTPIENVAMVLPGRLKENRSKAAACLSRLLPKEALSRPVSTLSGGMKRRVAIVRALSMPSDLLIMDEPFTGLDETLKQKTIQYIREETGNRLLLVSTHQEEDVALLGADLIRL